MVFAPASPRCPFGRSHGEGVLTSTLRKCAASDSAVVLISTSFRRKFGCPEDLMPETKKYEGIQLAMELTSARLSDFGSALRKARKRRETAKPQDSRPQAISPENSVRET